MILEHPGNRASEPSEDLMAVLVCEDAASVPRACALLRRVSRRAGMKGCLIYSSWTFGMLASARSRRLAASEAAAADLAVIAAREGPGLPEAVKDWISLWLATGEYHPRRRALVALLEPGEGRTGAWWGVRSELKHLADADAIDFFANGDEADWGTALPRGAAPPADNSSWLRQRARPMDSWAGPGGWQTAREPGQSEPAINPATNIGL